jgi:putative membrane protein
MKYLVWFLRIVVFIALFGLAVKNSATINLRFYFDRHFDIPLSLLVLGTFAAGVAVGISAALMTLIRQRRELVRRGSTVNQGHGE